MNKTAYTIPVLNRVFAGEMQHAFTIAHWADREGMDIMKQYHPENENKLWSSQHNCEIQADLFAGELQRLLQASLDRFSAKYDHYDVGGPNALHSMNPDGSMSNQPNLSIDSVLRQFGF